MLRSLGRMTTAGLLGAALLAAPAPAGAVAATMDLTIVAGNGSFGTPVDNDSTKLGRPYGLTFDPSGDLYFTEINDCRVGKMTPGGVLTVFAGIGGCGTATPGIPVRVGRPHAIARHNGDTYIGDINSSRIQKINSSGMLSTVSGSYTGLPLTDGPLISQSVGYPSQFLVVGDTMFMTLGKQAAKVDLNTMYLTVLAGTGSDGTRGFGGPATQSPMGLLAGVAVTTDGTVYLGDQYNDSIYRVAPDGTLSLVTTTSAYAYPTALALSPAGKLYVSLAGHRIAEVDTTATNGVDAVTPVAGNGFATTPITGPALGSPLSHPMALAYSPTGFLHAVNYDAPTIIRLAPSGPVAPQPPTSPTAQVGDESAVVGWTAPADNGGTPVTSYTVQAYAGGTIVAGRTCTATAPAVTCTVPNLTNGVAYTYRVTATNLAGTGAASSASTAVTPLGAPDAPSVGTASSTTPGSATLTWTAPVDTGGSPVTGYTVQVYSGGQPVAGTCAVSPPATTCSVSGLTNGTAYTLRVTATTSYATSAESADSTPVTPVGPPGAPTAVQATAGNAQTTVSWTTPGSNGGAAISAYTAQAYQAGVLVTGKSCATATLSCVISGLVNGAAYTVRVRAENGTTPGPASADSATVTPSAPAPAAPGAPGSAPTVRAGTSSIAVSWPGSSGPVSGYTAVASPGGNSCTSTSTSCVIGAEAGTTYTVTVQAQGPGGSSGWSSASDPVTPTAPIAPAGVPGEVPLTLTTDKGQLTLALPQQEITIIGTGFAPRSTARISIYSTPVLLGTVTTDANGSFSLPVTIPAALAAGDHTFLAHGVDASGTARQQALPVTIPPTNPNTSGTGDQNQNTDLPVPSGGGITLLGANGDPVSTVAIAGQGTYALDSATGIITFVPVAGFVGRATPVSYRITDSVGSVVTGSYTAVVTTSGNPGPGPGPGAPSGAVRLDPPTRLITRVDGTALIRVTHTAAMAGRSTVVLWSTVSGKRVSLGSAHRPAARSLIVPVPLNALGRAMTARPGGYPVTVAVTTTPVSGPALRTTAPTRVVLQHFRLPRSVYFTSDSTAVGRVEAAYLTELRGRLDGVRALTCVGHTDDRGAAAYARKLGLQRAQAVCRTLATGLGIRTIVVSQGKVATGNETETGRARNRRTDLTLHY